MTNEIPFTQFVMPHGRERKGSFTRPEPICAVARAVIQAGARFEIEMLSTGDVSMTVEHPEYEDEDRGPVAIEVCANGPEVHETIDRLVMVAAQALGVAA